MDWLFSSQAWDKVGVLPGGEATRLLMLMVLSWSMASHLAWAGAQQGELAAAGLPNRAVSGEELEDFLPIEPLWDVILPLLGLSISKYGVRLTLSFTFAEPLLLLLLPSMLGVLREFHEKMLDWHMGGIFGQPMLVAQVTIVKAELRAGSDLCVAFGALVGYYSLGAVLGGALRRCLELWLTPGLIRQSLRQGLVLAMVLANLSAVGVLSNRLGHGQDNEDRDEPEEQSLLAPASASSYSETSPRMEAVKAAAWRTSCRACRMVQAELDRAITTGMRRARLLSARALFLLAATIVIGPAPIPAMDLLAWTPLGSGFKVLCFDVVGVLSSALLVPFFRRGPWKLEPATCLDLLTAVAMVCCTLGVLTAAIADVSAFHMAMLAGLALSSCAAVANVVLTAKMVDPNIPDKIESKNIGVCLAWSLLFGGAAQLLGARLGQVLFLWSAWEGICGVALFCCLGATLLARGEAAGNPETLAAGQQCKAKQSAAAGEAPSTSRTF
eukprot:TRINITY_DN45179_c0_g1_i1.p1 TRINITY_DN45179_c0_g1~~TRINITY_DN45179_c0_g1_i1.p1  ORF type:complete len:498 (-),score=97.97 TRINITY_DN45179_c0_g1_i1:84-1577(-)